MYNCHKQAELSKLHLSVHKQLLRSVRIVGSFFIRMQAVTEYLICFIITIFYYVCIFVKMICLVHFHIALLPRFIYIFTVVYEAIPPVQS